MIGRGLVSEVYEGAREYSLSVGVVPVLVQGTGSRLSMYLVNQSGVTLYVGFSSSVSSTDYVFAIPAGSDPVQLIGVTERVKVYAVAASGGPYTLKVVELF
jgi:hypothetical protein